jgi:hypothetical protein
MNAADMLPVLAPRAKMLKWWIAVTNELLTASGLQLDVGSSSGVFGYDVAGWDGTHLR